MTVILLLHPKINCMTIPLVVLVNGFRTIPPCGYFSNHISRIFLNQSSHWFKLNDIMQVLRKHESYQKCFSFFMNDDYEQDTLFILVLYIMMKELSIKKNNLRVNTNTIGQYGSFLWPIEDVLLENSAIYWNFEQHFCSLRKNGKIIFYYL